MDKSFESLRPEERGIKVHIGSLISNELKRQRRPVAWLAQEICCDRTNVYKIFRKGSIDTELLCRISVALEHDFFTDFQLACGFQKKTSLVTVSAPKLQRVLNTHPKHPHVLDYD